MLTGPTQIEWQNENPSHLDSKSRVLPTVQGHKRKQNVEKRVAVASNPQIDRPLVASVVSSLSHSSSGDAE